MGFFRSVFIFVGGLPPSIVPTAAHDENIVTIYNSLVIITLK